MRQMNEKEIKEKSCVLHFDVFLIVVKHAFSNFMNKK